MTQKKKKKKKKNQIITQKKKRKEKMGGESKRVLQQKFYDKTTDKFCSKGRTYPIIRVVRSYGFFILFFVTIIYSRPLLYLPLPFFFFFFCFESSTKLSQNSDLSPPSKNLLQKLEAHRIFFSFKKWVILV